MARSAKNKNEDKRIQRVQLSAKEMRNTLCDKMGFSASEAYKMLRANLTFTLPDENGCKIIGVTSSVRSEGKSTSAVNTAYTIAETGKEVLLIDADMRLPSVSKKLNLPGNPGLSNVLAGQCSPDSTMLVSTNLLNWKIMPAGDIPPNPSELLGSDRMQKLLKYLSTKFDYVVIDLPPVNIVSDAVVVSKWIDGLVVVVRHGYTDRQTLNACMNQLSVLESKVLGFVMTDVPEGQKEYGKYGGKYYYGTGSRRSSKSGDFDISRE